MNPAQNFVPDPTRAPDGAARSSRRYTTSFADGLGDRLLTFDNSTGMSLELLRFKREFGDAPAFEKALRERVELLTHFHHPSVATVRGVERLDDGEGLVVVSKLTPGRRLSDLLVKARGPVFALELIRQLTPALAALQQAGAGVSHGALNAERIVVAREGRLVLVDHTAGSAVEALRLPVARLRSELGLVLQVGPDATHLDARSDVIQLAFVALSLLLGRSLDPANYPGQVAALLDEFTRAESGKTIAPLRLWLERALQVGVRPFANAKDAQDGLAELADERDPSTDPAHALLAFRSAEAGSEPARDAASRKPDIKPVLQEVTRTETPQADTKPLPAVPAPAPPAAKPVAAAATPTAAPGPRAARRFSTKDWALAGLGIIATLEAVAIAGLLYARPETATIDVRSPTLSALEAARTQPPPSLRIDPPVATPAPPDSAALASIAPAGDKGSAEGTPAAAPPAAAADRPVPAGSRIGGVRVSSPIDLQVFEDGRLLGSTAGPIAINEGTHELEVVNETLGFRHRQTVSVRAGQLAAVNIGVPNGRVSINAVPWAEVTIDGSAAGQTPLANLSLPIGSHEIVFRHPQFPEQRQTIVVKAEGLTRVSATLQR